MGIQGIGADLRTWTGRIDWKLLVLLVLFLNVKLVIKILALVLVYLLRFHAGFGFRLKGSRLPLFYPLIAGVALLTLLINMPRITPDYVVVFLIGLGCWLLCLLAIHQVKLSVEMHSPATIHRTVLVFFVINTLISACNLLVVMWDAGAVNPYLYQGQYQKYFINTGDYIKGVTFDTSTTNAVLNAMGMLYFLTRKQYAMTLVCMAVLLLTVSNFTNMVLLLVLCCLALFRSTKDQKSIMVVCALLLVVFMARVSPQNMQYTNETFRQPLKEKADPETTPIPITQLPDSLLSPEEQRQKTARLYLDSVSTVYYPKWLENQPDEDKDTPRNAEGRILIPSPDIHSAFYQNRNAPQPQQQALLPFIAQHEPFLPYASKAIPLPALPGKMIAMKQTATFMAHHPGKILTGNGMGNFSSKLAFRATGLGIAGGFPKQYTYIHPDFMANHLDVYLAFFTRLSSQHSLVNTPFSVYGQLISEYGLLGLAVFIGYYLFFFLRRGSRLTYGFPVLLLMMGVLFIDYWFEQLSVLVVFELLLLLNIRETTAHGEEVPPHA